MDGEGCKAQGKAQGKKNKEMIKKAEEMIRDYHKSFDEKFMHAMIQNNFR